MVLSTADMGPWVGVWEMPEDGPTKHHTVSHSILFCTTSC
nr:MAG TPA: hypothetical protein [Caudoviricetes sp.]